MSRHDRGLHGTSVHEWVTKQRHSRCPSKRLWPSPLLLEPGTANEHQRSRLIGCDPVETTMRSESFSRPHIDKRSVFLNREDANRSIPSVERVQKLPVSAHSDVQVRGARRIASQMSRRSTRTPTARPE